MTEDFDKQLSFDKLSLHRFFLDNKWLRETHTWLCWIRLTYEL